MFVDTSGTRFHNSIRHTPVTKKKNPVEHALEGAVSRALRDNLTPLQRTADELQHAYADLVAACASTKPSNALPALLRAQSAAAALAAGLSVLSNFVAVAWNPRDPLPGENEASAHDDSDVAVAEPAEEEAAAVPEAVETHPEPELEWVDEPRDDSELAERPPKKLPKTLLPAKMRPSKLFPTPKPNWPRRFCRKKRPWPKPRLLTSPRFPVKCRISTAALTASPKWRCKT